LATLLVADVQTGNGTVQIAHAVNASVGVVVLQIPGGWPAGITNSADHVLATFAELSGGHFVASTKVLRNSIRIAVALFTSWVVVEVGLAAFATFT